MANSLHAEPRRLYSWWWDSHISPKSSKWLQENLTDMDSKVKAMIKLIEEDADSFAKRAEMYYKKRPELINLVEEFYRAYRALAERYDHATGVLQHAHRTMAEAFPSQNSLASNDEPSSSPSGTVLEPHTDSDNLQNDSFCMSSHFHLIEQTGAYSEENDALTHRKGLQQLNDMFFEGEAHSHFHGVAKGLQSQEEEGNNCHSKAHDFADHLQIQVPNAKEDVRNELEPLKNQLSQLLTENQELKFQIASESERADKAEIEAQHLKNNHSKWNFEKETFIHQYQQSLTRISVLDTKISQAEDELKKFDDDVMMRARNLTIAEERCLLLEDKNQSLQLELDKSEQKTKSQQKLNQKLEELEKISIWIKDEQRRCVDVELALLSLQKLHSQSQEELKYLALEVQRGHDKLEELEPRNMSLEQDVCTLTKENSNLSEKNDSLVLKINDLVDQISNSMVIREKLDNELRLQIEESKVLRYELDSLKDDKKDLEWRHQSLTKDMEAVSLSAESLQVLVKELHDEALELKEICKKHEDENFLLLENLKNTEKVLERNLILENSLMDSNVELEGFRNEIKTLEGSCKSLHCELDAYITENFMLVSQVEIVARDMEKIMQKNVFLEGCVLDMNTELEGLRVSLKDLEQYCQTLHDQRVNLLDEKGSLVSQVEKLSQKLESLESRHAELEDRRLSLEKERYSALNYLKELEGFLKLEKEHHETLILSSKSQKATLENHIHLLQEEIQFTKEKFETEEKNFTSAVLEIFILQSCLCDMKEMNLNLSKDCQKQLEAFDSAEKLVSQLKQEDLIQKEKMMVLLKHNEKLVHGMHLLLGALNINEYESLGGVEDESLLQIIFAEFKMLQSKISDAQDEFLHFNLEISVRDTLLQQLGSDVKDMRMEKIRIEEEFSIVKKQLLGLQLKNQELREVNEDVKQELQVKGQREEELIFEVKILQWELSDSQEAYQTIQTEANKLIDENLLLTEKYYNLMHKKDAFEEEKSTALSEAMLHMLCKSFNAEEALGLKLDTDETNLLHAVMGIFGRDTKTMNDKIRLLEEENTRLMESFDSFVEYRNRLVILEFDLNTAKYTFEELSSQTETGKVLLTQRESELTEANHMVQAMQNRNRELTTRLEGLIQEISGAKAIREGLEKSIFTLSEDVACKMEEIVCISKENELLHGELEKLNSEVELLSNREEHMTYKLLKGKGEIGRCEVDTRKLSDDIRNSTDSEAVFEEKVVELELECENIELCAMLQRDVLTEEITSRNEFIKELKERLNNLEGENRELKAKMNAYLPYVMSLRESLLSLEDRTCLLAGLYSVYTQEKQHDKSNPLNEDSTAMDPSGVLELKKLIFKVESLEQVTTDIGSHLKQELFGSCSDLEAKRNDIKKINVKGNTTKEEDKMKMEIILQPNEEGNEHGMDYEQRSYDAKILKMNYENTKDIQLDQASSASSYRNSVGSYGLTRTDNSETDDQMFQLWEARETNCRQIQKVPVTASKHGIAAVEEIKNGYLSFEVVAEEDFSVDSLEVPTKIEEFHQEQCQGVVERITSDTQRLAALQVSIQEVMSKRGGSEKSKHTESLEHETFKSKIKEAEGALLELIDINGKLTKDVEYYSTCSDGTSGVQGTGETGKNLVTEHARRISEKAGMLELELQKIQYILLKAEEPESSKGRATDRRLNVLLKDYFYGIRNGVRNKKGKFCGCMRPKKHGD